MSHCIGRLYVVATPIGNLDDISVRAKATLKAVDWVACEDTRHSGTLFSHFAIKQTLIPLHEHNEHEQAQKLIAKLLNGESGALISDAGTPIISDPGFELIALAHENNIQVVPIPGPSAVVTALSALAIGGGAFQFVGFLPAKANALNTKLNELKDNTETLVFYEAPHRIKSTISALMDVFGENRLCGIARELTKKFESLYRGSLYSLNQQFAEEKIPAKGEFVIVVQGALKAKTIEPDFINILKILMSELPLKQAVKLTSEISGVKKNTVYETALSLQSNN